MDYSGTIYLYTELDAYPMPNITDMINNIAQYKYFSTQDLKSAYHQLPIQDGDKKYTAFEAQGKLYHLVSPMGMTDRIIQKEKLTCLHMLII